MCVNFPKLERLGLRYVPDLTGLPPLDTWRKLKSFIGWNIEESAGKRLKKQIESVARAKRNGPFERLETAQEDFLRNRIRHSVFKPGGKEREGTWKAVENFAIRAFRKGDLL